MRRESLLFMAAVVMLAGTVVRAQPVSGTCAITAMRQDALAPIDLNFPYTLNGESIPVEVDPSTGSISFDFGALPIMTFPNGFSDHSKVDTTDFRDEVVTGTIDAGGNVLLPHVRGINCTQGECGTPPCPCVPGNICSNDPQRVCAPQGTGDLACEDGGVCQGVCSNDLAHSCASDLDCGAGFCGQGVGMRMDATLTSATTTLDTFTLVGDSSTLFSDGHLRLVDLHRTPPETYGIGAIGITSLTVECDLDPLLDPASLPPPPEWTVKKGVVKLGKGDPGAGDDKLSLKGSFLPLAGEADFGAQDLSVRLATGDTEIAMLTIPAGSMKANKKGTKFKLKDKTGSVVEVSPPLPPNDAPSYKVSIKKKKDGQHQLALSAKNLDLDELNAAEVTTGIIFGFQTPNATSPVTAKGSKLSF